MMGTGLLNVSVSGLNAAQMGILTTSHNIANASTPGFSRQQIVQTTNTPLFSGAGFIGQGANVQTVKRVYSDFLANQVKNAETTAAELDTYATAIAQIDNLLGDPSAGLSPALQGFFNAVSDAAANPASIPSRQTMLSAGQSLVARFQGLDQQLTDMRDGVNSQVRSEVTTINSYVNQIADINQRIVVAQAAGVNQPANDLYDQRDKLLADVNKEIRITSHQESDGSVSLFFGSGQPLVVGTQVYQLQAIPDREDLNNLQIGLKSPGGDVMNIPESLVTGGNLGGLLSFRANTLNGAQNSIGRIALSIATNFNSQHILGQDLNGALGGNFFEPIALATLAAPTNTGNATLSATMMVSDYRVSYDQNNGGYTITRLADDADMGTFSALPHVVNGVSISLAAGVPANGDSFVISPDAPAAARVTAAATNTGSATLASSGSNVQTLTDSDYRLTLSATNTFTLLRLSDQQSWTGNGSTQGSAFDDLMSKTPPQGFDLSLGGTMLLGDSILIRPTRYAAQDMALAVTDARNIALAAPVRTSAAVGNGGTATISAGTVSDTATLQQAPFTLTYEAASNSLVGFPAGATVMVGNTTYKITDPTMRVPYAAGNTISLNGIAAVITGSPLDGDRFTLGANTSPALAPPPLGNTGFATLFGIPSAAAPGQATGGTSLSNPVTIVAGSNDQFMVALDGNARVGVTLPPGSYAPTSAGLVATVQTALDAALATALPAGQAATVSINAQNQLVITSNTVGAGAAVSLSNAGNTGTGVMVAGTVTSRVSLPAAPLSLTYHQATTTPAAPNRLTGFPVGSVVTVTPVGGRPTSYTIGQSTDAVPYTSAATIAFNGVSFSISGAAVEGDTFTLGPNPSGVADNRNATLLGALQTRNAMTDATATYQSAYAQIVSQIGNKAREVEVTLAAQEKLVTQGNDAIQSQSGVNLDEEAANLLRYQQAYQAASKVIAVSDEMFRTLLGILR